MALGWGLFLSGAYFREGLFSTEYGSVPYVKHDSAFDFLINRIISVQEPVKFLVKIL